MEPSEKPESAPAPGPVVVSTSASDDGSATKKEAAIDGAVPEEEKKKKLRPEREATVKDYIVSAIIPRIVTTQARPANS